MRKSWYVHGAIIAVAAACAGTALANTTQMVLTVNPGLPAGGTNFTTIQSAINSIPAGNIQPYRIDISPGTYDEAVLVPAGKEYITLNGTGGDNSQVIMTRYDWDGGPNGWEGSQPLRAYANNFTVLNLTLQNTWGDNGQAMALKTGGDKQIYNNVQILGWQDTLYIGPGRQYFENCTIKGRVDFLWGPGTAVIDNSNLISRVTSNNGGYITAANTPASQTYGYVIRNSHLSAETTDGSSLTAVTDLGRPWAAGAPSSYAQVSYINNVMDAEIRPEGWYDWGNPLNQTTARYSEYGNTGPGADTTNRVPWATQLTAAQADFYSTTNVFAGWNPLTTALVPVSWTGGGGDQKWTTAGNWDTNAAPMVGQNLYVQPDGGVTVTVDSTAVGDQLSLGKTGVPSAVNITSTGNMTISGGLFLNGGSSVVVDGGILTVPTVQVDATGTGNSITIKNNGQLNIGNWTGPWGPAGLLVINSGTFATKGMDGAQINMAPNVGDVAVVNVRDGDNWSKTRFIATGDGTSTINQTGGTINGTYGPYMGYLGTGQGTATYNMSGGTAFWLDPDMGKSVGGTFTVNQSAGTINALGATGTQYSYNDGIIKVGDRANANATWNLSGTGVLNHRGMMVGVSGTGTFHQTGGAVTLNQPITTSTKGMGLLIGTGGSSGKGLYEISGGSLTVQNGGLSLGYNYVSGGGITPATATGTFKVDGGSPTIAITGNFSENGGSTLAAQLDSTGLATIAITGNVSFASGALLDLSYLPGALPGTYTLMTWTGTETGTPTFSAGTDATNWSYNLDTTNHQLTVTVLSTPEPASLGVLGAAAAGLLLRRKRSGR
ncbi:MAG: pectinesterase family protein [Phycisphaerae bacterium]